VQTEGRVNLLHLAAACQLPLI